MSWCDLDLTFDLAVVILTFKILSGLYLYIFSLLINAVIVSKIVSLGYEVWASLMLFLIWISCEFQKILLVTS